MDTFILLQSLIIIRQSLRLKIDDQRLKKYEVKTRIPPVAGSAPMAGLQAALNPDHQCGERIHKSGGRAVA